MCIRSGKPSQLIYSGASLPNRPCQKISNTALRGRKKPPGTTSQNSTPESWELQKLDSTGAPPEEPNTLHTMLHTEKPTIHASNTTLFMLLAWLVPISSALSMEFYFFCFAGAACHFGIVFYPKSSAEQTDSSVKAIDTKDLTSLLRILSGTTV